MSTETEVADMTTTKSQNPCIQISRFVKNNKLHLNLIRGIHFMFSKFKVCEFN